MRQIVAVSLLLLGQTVIFIGCLGLFRLPDILCRAHALTKALTLGICCSLAALWVFLGADAVGWKVLLVIVFQSLTIPITGHLLAFSVWKKKLPLVSLEKEL